jgi:hypothetical protein
MGDDFNIDVFASIWEVEFDKLNKDFHAEITVTQQHLKAKSADKAAAKKAELAGMSVDERQWKTTLAHEEVRPQGKAQTRAGCSASASYW